MEELSSQHALYFLKVDQPVWNLDILAEQLCTLSLSLSLSLSFFYTILRMQHLTFLVSVNVLSCVCVSIRCTCLDVKWSCLISILGTVRNPLSTLQVLLTQKIFLKDRVLVCLQHIFSMGQLLNPDVLSLEGFSDGENFGVTFDNF